jgi:hypothetical protein
MLRSDRRGRLQPNLRLDPLPRALGAGCLRSTFPLRLHHVLPFLLASFGEEIGQNSCGRRFREDRRCGVLSSFTRLRIATEPTEEPFGLSACLALYGRVREVLVDITLGDIVRSDQIDPIILAGGGRSCDCGRGGALAALDFDGELACLWSHELSQGFGRVPRFGIAI